MGLVIVIKQRVIRTKDEGGRNDRGELQPGAL